MEVGKKDLEIDYRVIKTCDDLLERLFLYLTFSCLEGMGH